jgi:hypothetical protein
MASRWQWGAAVRSLSRSGRRASGSGLRDRLCRSRRTAFRSAGRTDRSCPRGVPDRSRSRTRPGRRRPRPPSFPPRRPRRRRPERGWTARRPARADTRQSTDCECRRASAAGTRCEAADRVARSVIARDVPWSNSPYAVRPLLGQNNATTGYEHNFDALRAAATWTVSGAGAESGGETTHRAALAVAERRRSEPAITPSHHGGSSAESSPGGSRRTAFAATLQDVLDGR